MTDAPKRIRIDPDYDGWNGQVIGFDADRQDDQGENFAEPDWPEYIRADLIDMDVLKRLEDRLTKIHENLSLMATGMVSRIDNTLSNTKLALTDLHAMMEKLK